MTAPTGLTIAELFDGSRCDWVIFSKAKRGPKVRRWCRTCRAFSRLSTCAGDREGHGTERPVIDGEDSRDHPLPPLRRLIPMAESKLTSERLWFLRGWATSGWRISLRHGKKWEAHLRQLVKLGLLEEANEMYRITEAGLSALRQQGGSEQ